MQSCIYYYDSELENPILIYDQTWEFSVTPHLLEIMLLQDY